LAEWANSDGVSEPLAELESRLSIHVVQGGGGWLLAGHHDEFLAVWGPDHILDLVVKHWDEVPILALVDPDILQGVLSVVALARGVVQILGPDQDGMPRWRRQNLDVLSPWTRDVELWSLQGAVEVVDIDEAIILGLGEDLSMK
jgi:hypothetical protein